MRGVAALALAGALCGACTTLPPPPAAGDVLSGRLAVRIEGDKPQSTTAAFELRGDARAGELDLSTPLGSMLARARWSPGAVELVTPRETRRYVTLDGVAEDVLGEPLPMAALFDWLRGRPWPGATSEPLAGEAGFSQLGWTVSLARQAEGWIVARRAQPPAVTVRAQVER